MTGHASLLMEVLNFDMNGEAQESLAAFDRAVTKYETRTDTSDTEQRLIEGGYHAEADARVSPSPASICSSISEGPPATRS